MKEILGYLVFFGSIFGGAYVISMLPLLWQPYAMPVAIVGVFVGLYLMGALNEYS